MRIFLILIAVVIFSAGIYVDRKILPKTAVLSSGSKNETSISDHVSGNSSDDNNEVKATPTPTPRKKIDSPSPMPTPIPNNPSSTNSSGNISDFQYPGSQIVNSDGSSMTLNSSDNIGIITKWYENKIKSKGFNVTSFVTTNANDKILNSLSAANGLMEIKVEIRKDPGNSTVSVSVTANN